MDNSPQLNLAYIVDDYEDIRLEEIQKETKYRIDQLILSKNFRLTNPTLSLKFYASAFDYFIELKTRNQTKLLKLVSLHCHSLLTTIKLIIRN